MTLTVPPSLVRAKPSHVLVGSLAERGGQAFAVSRVVPHPEHNYDGNPNDVGVLWLEEPLPLEPGRVQVIPVGLGRRSELVMVNPFSCHANQYLGFLAKN